MASAGDPNQFFTSSLVTMAGHYHQIISIFWWQWLFIAIFHQLAFWWQQLAVSTNFQPVALWWQWLVIVTWSLQSTIVNCQPLSASPLMLLVIATNYHLAHWVQWHVIANHYQLSFDGFDWSLPPTKSLLFDGNGMSLPSTISKLLDDNGWSLPTTIKYLLMAMVSQWH